MSLSIIGKVFGINNTYALVDDGIAPGLLKMLRLFGVEPRLHPGPDHALYGKMRPRSERAKFTGSQEGWMNPGQYDNPDNPEGFGRWLAPDLWAQTQGKIDILSCGLGTCGTMVGITRELRRRKESLEVVACCPTKGDAVPGPREQAQLWDVAFDWQNIANARMDMPATDSFAGSVALLRRGIMCGPSSGMNYAGLLRYLEQEKAAGRLAEKVASQGEVVCVFMCCDSPLQHVEDYYRVLGEEFFPAVQAVPDIDPVTGEDFSKKTLEMDFDPSSEELSVQSEELSVQRLGTVVASQEAVITPPTPTTPHLIR
jgi:cysteine synthase A